MRRFDELRVLELAGSPAGAYTAKLFADLGAKVLRVEPLGGDPLRLGGVQFGGMSSSFAYLNTSKQATAVDLSTAKGRDRLGDLLVVADAVIESSSPSPLRPVSQPDAIPGLVRTLISPFGQTGPYAKLSSNAFTDEAIGGHLYLNGEPNREPIRRPGLHVFYQAGTHAFIGTLAALRVREFTGEGQTVEVSHLEGFVALHQHTTSMWTHAGHILRRERNRQPGQWHPVGCYRCKGGFVHLSLPSQAMVEPFLAAAGLSELLLEPRFADDYARGAHKDEFDAAIQPWLDQHTAEEIVALGQEVLTAVGPVAEMLDVVSDEHLAARSYWTKVEGWPGIRFPQGPFRVASHVQRISAPPGPPSIEVPGDWHGPPPPLGRTALDNLAEGPLQGIRVLDLTRVWAGPYAGRMVADLGADVIAVEMPTGRGPRTVPAAAAFITHLYPDNVVGDRPWNRVGGFNKLFRNRRGVTLDLRNPRCHRLFEELIRSSDVVLENYSPRVMTQLGFSDDALLRLNPRIIHVSMPGFGATGPKRNWVAFGPLIEASCGLSAMTGYPDGGPYRSGIAWSDPVAGMNAAAGLLVALWDRDADPNHAGRTVEVAMIEAMVAFVGEEVVTAQIRGTNAPRAGNRDVAHAPQGCYRTAGVDRWIAISVTSDREWRALCRVASLPRALSNLTIDQRQQQHDEINELLTEWTRRSTPRSLMAKLQSAGVMAAIVSDGRDLVEDGHLADRQFWAILDQPDVGPMPYPGNPIRLSRTPVRYRRPAPTLGQHNREILQVELGLPDVELQQLVADGAIVDRPPA